jgi:hypothetical protein
MIYKLFLNNKTEITIDQADLDKLKANMGSGNLVQLKQAIVNPSYISAIVPQEVKPREVPRIEEREGKFVEVSRDIVYPEVSDLFLTQLK